MCWVRPTLPTDTADRPYCGISMANTVLNLPSFPFTTNVATDVGNAAARLFENRW